MRSEPHHCSVAAVVRTDGDDVFRHGDDLKVGWILNPSD